MSGRDATLQSFGDSAERRRLLELMLRKRGIGIETSRIPRRRTSGPCVLSHAQQRLWFIDQLGERGGAAYHIAGAVRLLGALNRAALRAALDAIVRRHEVLRTRFAVIEGSPMQVISETARFSLQEHDLSGLEAPERESQVRQLAQEEIRARFDLAAGPLVRGRLLRCAEQEHVLLLTLHHVISDGWSMGILIRELSTLYAAFAEGKPDPLPPLPIQYADYAVWQREWLHDAVLERQLAFWKEHLHGAPALLELPADRPRPISQTHCGGTVRIALSPDFADRIRALANRHRTTLFVVLHTAFAILLSGLSGQKDIVIGVPVANRRRTETEPLIGFFVNTLALRTRLSDDATVASLLEQVRTTTLAGHDNQDVPFEKVVEAINPPRSLSRSPVFQAMLVLQNAPRGALELPGLTLAPVALWNDTEKFDLTVSLQESGDGIVGTFSYASDLFDRCTIERWVKSFEGVLAEMVENVEKPVGAVSLLSATERSQVIAEFNATRIAYPPPAFVHELFERQVRRTPDAIAVMHENCELTYADLNVRANQLAHALRKRGAGPDRPVAICLERGPQVAVAVLAVLKAGSAYLPLDPAYPAARLEHMLSDASPGVVLAQRATLPVLENTTAPVILLDENWQAISQEDACDPGATAIGLTPEHPGYVIYTSGSTGLPKAVVLPHRALANLMHWHLRAVPPAARVLQFASLSFDVSCLEFFAAWGCGGAAVIPTQEIRYDPSALVRFMQAHGVDKAIFPVTVLQQIAERPDSADRLTQLRHVIATGEQLKITPAVRKLFERLPECVLHNYYGPSETHVATAFTLSERASEWPDHPPIGRPIANTQIYILNANRQPVPIGVIGELCIGGAGVATGYLNRPALTAERFVPDPFSEVPARMYRTGDLARWRADGTLEYLGRNDHQVKIRGFRVEPGEIEACLSRHECVRKAVVLAREDVPGDRRLVAYFTSTSDSLGSDELRAHLRESLPEYMIPAAFVRLDTIPLTPNGKVDRDALQRLGAPDNAGATYESPVGEVERALATIWQELLKVDRVGRHDNFFDLGGHSMLTASLIRRLQEVGLMVSLATVFRHPTLKSLAECLEMGVDQDLVPNPILLREGEGTPLFLVHEVSGDVLPYLPLARLLTNGIPVWGLQSLGIWHLESLEQLAAEHVEAMRRVQPRGPYRLGGWSLGALIAYEMACQLVGADETVEFLGMIDAFAPLGTSREEMDDLAVLDEFVRSRWSEPEIVRELTSLGSVEQFYETCKAKKYLPTQLTFADIQRLLRNRRLIPEIVRRYSPVTLPLKVDFFDAEDDRPRNWEALIGDSIIRHPIGGTHRTIMQPPHLQRLAAAMSEALGSAPGRKQVVQAYSPVCPIHLNTAAQSSVFCIPGAGASVACFLLLAQALGSGFNVYGLQPRGLEGECVPHSSVTAAAKVYLQALRKVCPTGPYRLLGHSFGGWVAFEIAHQLREQGEEVATLAVLDSEAPRGERRHYTRTDLFMRLIDALEQASGRTLGLTARDLQPLHNSAQIKLLRDRMVAARILPRDAPLGAVQGTMRVFARNLHTVYLPTSPIDAEIALFQAKWPGDAAREREMAADAADWSKLARSLRVFEMPGNHMTMLGSPHVEPIADHLRRIWTDV